MSDEKIPQATRTTTEAVRRAVWTGDGGCVSMNNSYASHISYNPAHSYTSFSLQGKNLYLLLPRYWETSTGRFQYRAQSFAHTIEHLWIEINQLRHYLIIAGVSFPGDLHIYTDH